MQNEEFIEEFKDALYDTMIAYMQGIVDNDLKAKNEDKWITIHPHGKGDDGDGEGKDYRRLLIKDGEDVEDAMKRQGFYKKRQAKGEKKEKEEIRNLTNQVFHKKKYYERISKARDDFWKKFQEVERKNYITWDDSEEDQKIKREKIKEALNNYYAVRDESNKAFDELRTITNAWGNSQKALLDKILPNINIEKSLKNYDSKEITKKIKDIIEQYDEEKINKRAKEIGQQIDIEKDKWLKYLNSAPSTEVQNERLKEYDDWFKNNELRKESERLFAEANLLPEKRMQAISKALQINNGGEYKLYSIKGSKLANKIKKTNELLSGIIPKEYLPEFEPYAKGSGERANSKYNVITISSKDSIGTYIHESMHWLEEVNPEMLANSMAFLEYRTKGETPKALKELTGIKEYKPNEIAKPDKFFNAYCGKIYKDATEIMSMGIQRLFEEPKKFMEEDKEYFDFVIANLQGKI